MKSLPKQLPITLSFLGLVTALWISPAIAQSTPRQPVSHPTRMRSVVPKPMTLSPPTISQRSAKSGTAPTIMVWADGGTNLSFLATGEVVQKAWLDPVNPTRVTLDFDGQLCGAEAQPVRNACLGATVLHLKQISPLPFPNLPKADSTLLSVITKAPDGNRSLYTFRIVYGSGRASYHTISLQPDPAVGTASTLPARVVSGSSDTAIALEQIEKGLEIARERRWIYAGTPLWRRIQHFMALVRTGRPVTLAAQQAGISTQLVTRLLQLGFGETAVQSTI